MTVPSWYMRSMPEEWLHMITSGSLPEATIILKASSELFGGTWKVTSTPVASSITCTPLSLLYSSSSSASRYQVICTFSFLAFLTQPVSMSSDRMSSTAVIRFFIFTHHLCICL